MPTRRAGFARWRTHWSSDGLFDAAGHGAAAVLLDVAAMPASDAMCHLGASRNGLADTDAAARLSDHGLNQIRVRGIPTWRARTWASVRSPYVAMLAVLDVLVAATGELLGVGLLTTMLAISVVLRWHHQHRFDHLLVALRGLTATRVTVLRRSGRGRHQPAAERQRNARLLVPGDLIRLSPGETVPADCRLLHASGLTVNQAILTGESAPVTKSAITTTRRSATPGAGWAAVLTAPTLCLTGTTVVTGTAWAVVISTGPRTVLGATARHAGTWRAPTYANLGLRGVTWLLIRLLACAVPVVFTLTALAHGGSDLRTAALFTAAAAVGLVPEMLPVVLAAAHGRGLSLLAAQHVVATRPAAVQDLAAMDVLCTDKTGTLTTGEPSLAFWLAPDHTPSPEVLEYAILAAAFAEHSADPLDAAILARATPLDRELATIRYQRQSYLPFDPVRRRTTVVLDSGSGTPLTITKGSVNEIMATCAQAHVAGAHRPLTDADRARIDRLCTNLRRHGYRLLALAYHADSPLADEPGMVLVGILAFHDPPRPDAAAALAALADLGVRTVMVTGDAAGTAAALATQLGIPHLPVVTGSVIDSLDDAHLADLTATASVFAEVDPLQKARIVRVLRATGRTVGYLADGINDTAALRAADVGISFAHTTPLARHAADAILLDAHLTRLVPAIRAARHATLNATKYLKATLAANLSNLLSMLAAALLLPFAPMLPTQILAQNLVYDLAQLTLPTDRVAPDQTRRPHRWSTRDLARFMCCFAPLSSLFDLATFWALWHLFAAHTNDQALFSTGWFLEGLLTQAIATHILRTPQLPRRDHRPARSLALATLTACAIALALPYSPLAAALTLTPPPATFYLFLAVVTPTYLTVLHVAKTVYRRSTHHWL